MVCNANVLVIGIYDYNTRGIRTTTCAKRQTETFNVVCTVMDCKSY